MTTTSATYPDRIELLSLAEAAALPGMLGRIAPAVLRRRGEYGYTEFSTGARVLLLAKEEAGQ